jgi:hypothetical protein
LQYGNPFMIPAGATFNGRPITSVNQVTGGAFPSRTVQQQLNNNNNNNNDRGMNSQGQHRSYLPSSL